MTPGLRSITAIPANVVFTTNVVLSTVGLTSPIAKNERQKLRFWVPFSLGATGGCNVQLAVPAGGTIFLATIKYLDVAGNAVVLAGQTASAAFGNALTGAANYWVEVEALIINGATAGNVDLLMAQNSSDALSMTVLRGGSLEVVKF